MMRNRFPLVIALGALAGILVVGLLLGLSATARGGGIARAAVAAEAESAYPGSSLQNTGPVTAYLPLVYRAYPPPPPVFGVEMHVIGAAQGLSQAVDAGPHWVRSDFFHWDRIEPWRTNPPTYHWDVVDENSLRNASEHDLHVIATIKFTPAWAQKYPGSYCGPIAQEKLDEFAQFLKTLVRRYKNPPYNVEYWELGNEPDHAIMYNRFDYGCWGQIGEPYYGGRYYGEMLKVAYPAIKAADPDAQVLIGGLLLDCDPNSPPPGRDCTISRFLEGILEAGGGPYFDVVSFHAYADYLGTSGQMRNGGWPGSVTAIPEKTAFLRGVLNRYGYGNKALMNTESALLCGTDSAGCRDTQGMYIPRAYAEALALDLLGQVHFDLKGTWKYSGLLEPDLTCKPAYYAYKAAADFLSAVTYVGPATGYPPGIQGYTFRRWDRLADVDVIWSVSTASVPVTLSAGATVYTQYNEVVAPPIWVGYAPVYVKRPP